MDRLRLASCLIAYCGIVPTVRSSGEREQQGSITQRGRSEVRAAWIQAAQRLSHSDRGAGAKDAEFSVLSLAGWNAVPTAAAEAGCGLIQGITAGKSGRPKQAGKDIEG